MASDSQDMLEGDGPALDGDEAYSLREGAVVCRVQNARDDLREKEV